MKILVRGTNWVGDAVMSIPALRELRRIFPDAKISLHTRSWAEEVFCDASFIDEIISFDRGKWAVKDVYENSQFLREDSFDLAVLLPNSFESALTTFLTRIPRRFGYNKDARGLLLTDPIAVPEWKDRRHEVFYYLHLIGEVERRILGRDTLAQIEPDVTLEISDLRKAAARELLATAAAGIDPANKTVALGVGSTNSRAKRWPVDRFARLSDRLQTELGASVVLVGSKEDSGVAGKLQSLVSKPVVDLTGKTELGEAAALLSVVDLLISNDMGLAHIAPAVGTRTVVMFGPTNPETTRPYSPIAEVVRKQVECSGCMLRDCPIDHRCMTLISVEEVFDAAKSHLFYETTSSIS